MTSTTINIDLNDPRSLQIAEVIGNPSCKKILGLISEKDLTETDIARELKIPLNTVDYNIKKLLKAGLIESGSHWWSTRGKKMPTYRISNKKIIISPKSFSTKNLILPIISSVGVLFVLGRKFLLNKSVVDEISLKSADLASGTSLMASAPAASDLATETIISSPSFFSSFASWEWVLLGIWVGAIAFFVLTYITERRSNK